MLSRLVITFLPSSKYLLISWLQSPSAVILEPTKIKSDTVSTVSPSICHEVMGMDAMILVFWMLNFKPDLSLSSFLQSSNIRVFSDESTLCIRWLKYWSFSFSIRPSNEYAGLISFKIDLLDLFAVQGILKSLLQHHSSKASILQCSAFFIVQVSHPYLTIGKTIAFTT